MLRYLGSNEKLLGADGAIAQFNQIRDLMMKQSHISSHEASYVDIYEEKFLDIFQKIDFNHAQDEDVVWLLENANILLECQKLSEEWRNKFNLPRIKMNNFVKNDPGYQEAEYKEWESGAFDDEWVRWKEFIELMNHQLTNNDHHRDEVVHHFNIILSILFSPAIHDSELICHAIPIVEVLLIKIMRDAGLGNDNDKKWLIANRQEINYWIDQLDKLRVKNNFPRKLNNIDGDNEFFREMRGQYSHPDKIFTSNLLNFAGGVGGATFLGRMVGIPCLAATAASGASFAGGLIGGPVTAGVGLFGLFATGGAAIYGGVRGAIRIRERVELCLRYQFRLNQNDASIFKIKFIDDWYRELTPNIGEDNIQSLVKESVNDEEMEEFFKLIDKEILQDISKWSDHLEPVYQKICEGYYNLLLEHNQAEVLKEKMTGSEACLLRYMERFDIEKIGLIQYRGCKY